MVDSNDSKSIGCKDPVGECRETPVVLVVPLMQQVVRINAKVSFSAG